MIRIAPDDGSGSSTLVVDDAIFRFVPDFIAKLDWARKTYNARAETIATKPTYRQAWAKSQRCIIPADWIYEFNHETGKPVRWNIHLAGGVPMGIAGIFNTVTHPDGREMFTMSMVTVNADDHPVMSRFHAPGDEKRMVVILDPSDYSNYLSCPVDQASSYFKQWMGPMEAHAAPLPPRVAKPKPPPVPKPLKEAIKKAPRPPKPPEGPVTGDLF